MAFPNGRPRSRRSVNGAEPAIVQNGHEHREEEGLTPVIVQYGKRRDVVYHRHRLSDRYEMLLDGRLTVDDLDDEEIIRGRLRNSVGTFSGRPPTLIPYSLHTALRTTMEQRTERRLIESIPEMVDKLVEIAGSPWAAADARVKAAIWIVERGIGKAVDRQQIEQTIKATWEVAAESGELFVDIEPTDSDPEIVDALLVEDEPKEIPKPPEQFKLPPPEIDTRAPSTSIDLIQPEPAKPEQKKGPVKLG